MLRSPARLRLITSHLSPVVVVPKPSQAKQMSTNPVRKLADGGEIEHGLQLDAQRADMVQDIISVSPRFRSAIPSCNNPEESRNLSFRVRATGSSGGERIRTGS